MSYPISRADPIEAETFLYKYAEVEAVDLLVPDGNGVLRGKRIHRDALAKVYRDGMPLPGSVFASLITGDTAPGTELGLADGDADRICWPVAGSLRLAPWQPRPLAQLLLAMSELDGAPFFADPRHVLGRVVERFQTLQLEPTVAFELEFYLLDRQRAAGGAPQPPLVPDGVNALRESQTQVYGIRELELFDTLLDDIVKTAERQDLPVENLVSEYAPGQYEVNLCYQTDPFAACDHAVMLKRLVTALARKHGLAATFMAKPYDDWAGNGMHVHLGLRDRDGNNVFADVQQPVGGKDSPGTGAVNAALGQALAGLAATMVESVALCAPNVNAYRRLQPGAYAPLSADWGYNNRTVALRVPTGPAEGRRIEHRIAGADANPYLVLAAVMAAVHHGITRRLTPAEPVYGNAYRQASNTADLVDLRLQDAALPRSMADALAAFVNGGVLPGYLDERFCRLYRTNKLAELGLFERRVTALEHCWYL